MKVIILVVILVDLFTVILSSELEDEWEDYKVTYRKSYDSPESEEMAKNFYANNRDLIADHNYLYNKGYIPYKLAINQFSDMPFRDFHRLFPSPIPSKHSKETPPPTVPSAAPFYDPRALGFQLNIEDQGTKCNSGWAYATAKSIELYKAIKTGVNSSSLSAQNLIDCAGGSDACNNQSPQAAFDYLTKYKMNLHLERDYKNQNRRPKAGKCTPPSWAHQLPVVTLSGYSNIRNCDDESLMSYVSAGIPVVVEIEAASFQFMHYSEGIYRQVFKLSGSHFMVVIGYGTDKKTNTDYWLLQNSFGTTWGVGGLMKWSRKSKETITKNAIFPVEY